MKIAHISDLHFYIPELKEKPENLQHIIEEKFDFDLYRKGVHTETS